MTPAHPLRMSEDDLLARVRRYVRERLPEAEVSQSVPATVAAWHTAEPVPWAVAARQDFLPITAGTRWGDPWSTVWLRVAGRAPAAGEGERVELRVDLGFVPEQVGFQAEGLGFGSDGSPLKAVNPASRWLPIDADRPFDLFIEAAANPTILHAVDRDFSFAPTPLGARETAGSEPLHTLGAVDAVAVHLETEQLGLELTVLGELLETLSPSTGRRARVRAAVEDALDALDPSDIRGTAAAARRLLEPVLAVPAHAAAHRVTAVGHAHIDTAWLWPFRETRRKVARTVANVLQQMDHDADLVYAMSSAQQYAWLLEDHPALFEQVRDRVAEGRFIPVGGMWVESDVTMPSGESLVRQFLYGSAFFEREFGPSDRLGWLPDSFGYSGALPQILRAAGIRHFVTQKLSWNRTNRFPHHLFEWEGIDGSRVVTHFPSADMYNSGVTVPEVTHAERNFTEKAVFDASILPFGYGDGGGGPTREMLTRTRLLADLDGSPRVVVEPPQRYFERLEATGVQLPVWFGELYLESHRGVYTSQARTKAANRRGERALRSAELWSTHAMVASGREYPFDELQHLWHELLLMQFHDVLPGSSISWVHDEAERRLAEAASRAEEIAADALDAVLAAGSSDALATTVIANATPATLNGVPGYAVNVARDPSTSGEAVLEQSGEGLVLTNEALVVRIDSRGLIAGIRDRRRDRELVPAGWVSNALRLHRDAPTRWDAWDLDPGVDGAGELLDAVTAMTTDVRSDGSVAVEVQREFGGSRAIQCIRLLPGDARLELEVAVDWQEQERLLQLELPLGLAAASWHAETQYGFVERPTHRNTSWDEARYQACAHRWVHVAEPDYGVALVNDRTYGHSVRRIASGDRASGVAVRASLLKGSRFPDPSADRGDHVFRFALLPGASVIEATHAGHGFAASPTRLTGHSVKPLVRSSATAVVVDAVKAAEDRSGDVIVRAYECGGTQARTTLSFGFAVHSVIETDLLERPRTAGAATDPEDLHFLPFQLRTFRVRPGGVRTAAG